MNWYELMAPFYEIIFVNPISRYHRNLAVQALQLQPGFTVLDLACGTGMNFAKLIDGIGPQGTLIGTDYSPKMLAQAEQRVKYWGWGNVHLLQADAAQLLRADLVNLTHKPELKIDRVLCTLGMSVIPEWERAFERSFEVLASGGCYVIMDYFFERRTLYTQMTTTLLHADATRRFWEPLQRRCEEYTEVKLKPHIFENYPSVGAAIIVSGTKNKELLEPDLTGFRNHL
jgi:ubiquinone/menaquinone biosynthesis C-methylase UbiE